MKKNFTKVILLSLGTTIGVGLQAYAQPVDIFNENMGTPPGTTAIGTNTFENTGTPGLTYSGSGDVRTTNPSSGYATSSGSGNVMLNTTGENFIIDGINIDGFDSITVFYGVRKGAVAESGSTFNVNISIDGSSVLATNPVLPTGTGTTGWYYVSAALPISEVGGLMTLSFLSSGTTEFRIDDIYIVGKVTTTSVDILEFTGRHENDNKVFSWLSAHERNLSHFELEGSTDGIRFDKIHMVHALNTETGSEYTATISTQDNNRFYRLKSVDIDGKYAYTKTITLNTLNVNQISILNTISSDNIQIISPSTVPFKIFSAQGALVLSGELRDGVNTISITGIATGNYILNTPSGNFKFIKN